LAGHLPRTFVLNAHWRVKPTPAVGAGIDTAVFEEHAMTPITAKNGFAPHAAGYHDQRKRIVQRT